MTQSHVANGRYSKSYVSAIENGHVMPSIVALDFVAAQLGTTVGSLLSDDGKPGPDW